MEKFEIENLTFEYPAGSLCALSGVNLSISQGEFITICGKSGCGKTTLLRLLKPPIAPHGKTEGRILFEGRELSSLSIREQASQIGFVMQNPDSQIVTDKVWHELAFGLESLGLSTPQIRSRVAEMASYFGIESWFHKKVTELSGGQKQLLNLASVMAMQPSVLILDEPTAQLDPIAAQEFIKALEKINKDLGTTIIMAEHRLEEVFAVSDRIIVIDGGKIIADTPPSSAGMVLKNLNHDMYSSLPAPVRIFEAVDGEGPSPVTIRGGRIWLENFTEKNSVKPLPIEECTCKNSATVSVELKDIFFKYEENSADILKALSLKANKGELLSIVGGNGVGKTTLLSLIGGLNAPYRGKVLVNGKSLSDIPDLHNGFIGFLPQNPQVLFSEKTVLLDLLSMFREHQISNDEKNERINAVASLCQIDTLLERHPYDLSGGEQQRVALAKVLLTSPEILLLDEPTKGMDSHFKEVFADILSALKEKEITIIMVSHDIEFCAEYSDRCAMLFDGSVASEGTPRSFFSSNSFYTTSSSKMARNIIQGAILADDVIYACNGTTCNREPAPLAVLPVHIPQKHQKQKEKRRISPLRIACGIGFGLLFIITYILGNGVYTDWRNHIFELIIFAEVSACLAFFIPKGNPIKIAKIQPRKSAAKSLLVTALTLCATFLTLFSGIFLFGDRRYYFISIMIIAEIFVLFFGLFEGRKTKSRELVIIAILCAIGVAGRGVFYMLPQFKPVIAIVIIAGICFGGKAGFLIGAVTGFVSNFFFGQGPWTPWQMVGFGLIGLLAGLFFRKGFLRPAKIALCIFGAITTVLVYGGLTNASMVIMYQENPNLQMFIASFAAGLPFDLMHAVSTVFFLWFMAEPMTEKLERVKIKYGITE